MSDTSTRGTGNQPHRTRLAPRWVRKSLIIIVVLLAFGAWGLLDAVSIYPKRGANVAEYREFKYLEQYVAKRGFFDTGVNVADPDTEYERLETQGDGRALADPVEETRRQWLESLDRIGQLDASQTTWPRDDFRGDRVPDAQLRFDALRDAWTRVPAGGDPKSVRQPPKPLAAWDIPSQWGIMAICWAIAAFMMVTFLRAARKSYQFEAESQRLTLADGTTLVPSDIEEFDKRRWDKFYVYLKVAASHPQHGGKELELDLYRYEPLEEWILAMERTRFPDRAEDEESKDAKRADGGDGGVPAADGKGKGDADGDGGDD